MSSLKVIISGGGTGGHIFPAVAIANALKERNTQCEILFVGAQGKMEMEKVPEAGYEIVGLPIRGIQRSITAQNLKVPFLLLKSLRMAKKAIRQFQPDAVIGVGGYASAAVVFVATRMKVPTLIQEQNSFPGITNKILSKRVNKVCVAFDRMERFFPKDKILRTGNPIRQDIFNEINRTEAFSHFNLDPNKKTILAIGGSLGARTINNCMLELEPLLKSLNAQLIWQCGKGNFSTIEGKVKELDNPSISLRQFIQRMDLAYGIADLVVSRAGALSVSEIAALKKPSILIPLPIAAEDHQTKNAQSLVDAKAALLLKDDQAVGLINQTVQELLSNDQKLDEMKQNIEKVFSNSNAANDIAKEIEILAGKDV